VHRRVGGDEEGSDLTPHQYPDADPSYIAECGHKSRLLCVGWCHHLRALLLVEIGVLRPNGTLQAIARAAPTTVRALRKVDDLKRWQADALGVSEVIDAVPGTEGEEKEDQPLAPRQAVGPQCPRNDLTFGSIRSGVQKGSQTNSTSTPVTPSSIRVT
jgi:hypothetical protein